MRGNCRRSSESFPSQRDGFSQAHRRKAMKRSMYLSRNLLKSATSFHGHLGPYLVLGLRMGLVAVRTLRPHGHRELSATIWTKRSPPNSCLLDGVQLSSGCTLGKGNLRVKNASQLQARFLRGNRSLVIRPTREAAKLLLTISRPTPENRLRRLAFSLGSMSDRDLFVVKPGLRTTPHL